MPPSSCLCNTSWGSVDGWFRFQWGGSPGLYFAAPRRLLTVRFFCATAVDIKPELLRARLAAVPPVVPVAFLARVREVF